MSSPASHRGLMLPTPRASLTPFSEPLNRSRVSILVTEKWLLPNAKKTLVTALTGHLTTAAATTPVYSKCSINTYVTNYCPRSAPHQQWPVTVTCDTGTELVPALPPWPPFPTTLSSVTDLWSLPREGGRMLFPTWGHPLPCSQPRPLELTPPTPFSPMALPGTTLQCDIHQPHGHPLGGTQ